MKWISGFLILISFYSFSENLGLAPIDPEYESKFFNIYKNFHSRKLTSSQWLSLISQRAADVYTVQKKDTLWDISQVLFGDSNYWPKLWSLNDYIKNPHKIKQGNRLMVVQGTESGGPQTIITTEGINGAQPPFLGEETLIARDSQNASSCSQDLNLVLNRSGKITQVYSKEIQCSDVQKKLEERRLEDATHVSEKLVANIPSQGRQKMGAFPKSLPPLQIYSYEDDFSGLTREKYPAPNLVERYLVERSDIRSLGKVQDFDFVPIKGSEIILNLDVPANVGDRYTLIRPIKKIPSVSLFIRGPLGYEVQVVATVRIKAPVQNESGFFFATVENLFNPIELNYDVVETNLQFFDFEAPIRWGEGSAQIVGLSKDQSYRTLMPHDFIYLNRGRGDNINKGDTLDIWANPRFHRKASRKPLGKILIVHSSDRFSTGFVTELESHSYLGDYVRGPNSNEFFSEDAEDSYEPESFEEDEEDSFGDEEENDFEENRESFEDESSFDEEENDFEENRESFEEENSFDEEEGDFESNEGSFDDENSFEDEENSFEESSSDEGSLDENSFDNEEDPFSQESLESEDSNEETFDESPSFEGEENSSSDESLEDELLIEEEDLL